MRTLSASEPDPGPAAASSSRHPPSVRLLLVEDCRLVRDAMVGLLTESGWVDSMIATGTVDEAAHHCVEDPPDAALVRVGATGSLARLRAVRDAIPHIPLIAWAVEHSDEQIIGCAQAGASGFLELSADAGALRSAVGRVLRGEAVCTPTMTAALLRRLASPPGSPDGPPDDAVLTPREREVLLLIERGWTNKQIAAELGVELRTVKNHVHNLLDKLQVSRRGEAAARLRSARVPPTSVLRTPAVPRHGRPTQAGRGTRG